LTITLRACSFELPRCKFPSPVPLPARRGRVACHAGHRFHLQLVTSKACSKGISLLLRAHTAQLPFLVVGRNGSWGTPVLKSLEKFGTELLFVAPQTVTSEYVRKGAYNLILLDSTVPPEQRRQLASELIGSEASIFYTFPVENGCWWLPALHHGKDCHGTPAFRRNEFPFELERLLRSA